MKKWVTRRRVAAVFVTAALVALTGALVSSGAVADDGQHGFAGQPVGHRTDDPQGERHRDVSPPLRDIAPIAPEQGELKVKHEYLMRPPATGTGAPDTTKLVRALVHSVPGVVAVHFDRAPAGPEGAEGEAPGQ